MSLSQAQSWLQKHSDSIPALGINHQKIIEHLENENNSQDIVLCAAADPGLSLTLLKKINVNRGESTGKDIVDSTKSAFSLLGNQVSHTLLKESSVAENVLKQPHQLFLFQQIINRSFLNQIQVAEWALENGYQHIEQLKSSALLTYAGEALCCVHDYENYFKYVSTGSPEGGEKNYFGFNFHQLTETLCQQLNLPTIIIQSLPHKNSNEQREQFLFFIAKLCQQCEHGWYTENLLNTFEKFSQFLQHPVDQVISKFHQVSINAAKQSILPDAWQAASRLILISDSAWTPPAPVPTKPQVIKQQKTQDISNIAVNKATTETTQKAVVKDDIFARIKSLLQQDNVTKSDILNACLSGLFEDFAMSKVSLLLLSQDKQKLNNRMSRGLARDASFNKYQIETAKAGLFKILLNKPQAIWVNHISYKKYQKLIPPTLLANIMTTDFLAMSLFIGEKPIGIIYADRTDSTDKIDEKAFTQFKQLITLTSKALTFLSKK